MANMAQAIRMALAYGEQHLGVTDIFGEDVGPPLGGVFTCTQGLKTTWNSPLDERGIIGCGLGLAMSGENTVCEIQFSDYIFNTIDLLKLVGNYRWVTGGQFKVPLTIMTPNGAGIHGSVYHSHSSESILSHIPGIKMVTPSTPLDAYGLMMSALKDPNPVIFLIPKALIRVKGKERIPGEPESEAELRSRIDAPLGNRDDWQAQWPDLQEYYIPLGKAKKVHEGSEVTLLTYARHVLIAEEICQNPEFKGKVDLIDLRSLYPLDMKTIRESVQKTGRLLIVNEDTEVTNFAEHVLRKVMDECFYALKVKPEILMGANVPGIGLAETLEEASVPQKHHMEEKLRAIGANISILPSVEDSKGDSRALRS